MKKFRHRIPLIAGLFLTVLSFNACHHDQRKSFRDLSTAFLQWYHKGNPVLSTEAGIHEFDRDFRRFDKDYQRDHLADLKRFDLELSQIDRTKLPENEAVDYLIMSRNIQRLIYENRDYREEQWNPMIYQREINLGLTAVVEDQGLSMNDKTEAVTGRLEHISRLLDEAESTLLKSTESLRSSSVELLDRNVELLRGLPLQLSGDNFTLDKIDLLIAAGIKRLEKHRLFLEKIELVENNLPLPELFRTELALILGEEFTPDSLIALAKQEYVAIQNELFSVVYPHFLRDNDEPVWVGRQDTLQVVAWAFDRLAKGNKDPDVISANASSSLKKIQSNLRVNNLLKVGHTAVEIRWEMPPLPMIAPIWLTTLGHRKPDGNVYLSLAGPSTAADYRELSNPILADILMMMAVYPGALAKFEYDLENPSALRKVFPDLANLYGWPLYSTEMFLRAGYGKDDFRNLTALLGQKLKITLAAWQTMEYYTALKPLPDIRRILKKEGFLTDAEAVQVEEVLKLSPWYYPAAFVGTEGFERLRRIAEDKSKAEFSPVMFHTRVLSAGSIPLEYLELLGL
ncbi:MAG: DUF885 domain-containing protein [FCB group bacterium]|nr:DUF885 domain-containing protein [FCB group bacterium]